MGEKEEPENRLTPREIAAYRKHRENINRVMYIIVMIIIGIIVLLYGGVGSGHGP